MNEREETLELSEKTVLIEKLRKTHPEYVNHCGEVKIPRNSRCLCGSGKKYKHCCMRG